MKQIAIIGAGPAGLTAGVYARQSGYDVTIYESHAIPGGNCTSWDRSGYHFEGGLHWLTGSHPDQPIHKIWRNVGAIDDETVMRSREIFCACLWEGEWIKLYRDVEALEAHLNAVSPEDEKAIKELCKTVRRFAKFAMPVTDIKGVKVAEKSGMPMSELASMLPAFASLPKLTKISCGAYCERFRHPGVRALLCSITGPDYTAVSMLATLGTLASGDGGYPEGGSLAMAQRMAKRFTDLGGQIAYKSRVERILIKDGAACGLVVNGIETHVDAVIAANDTLVAIDKLVDPPLHESWMDDMRRAVKPINNTFLCFGIEDDLSDLPEMMLLPLETPFRYADQSLSVLEFNHYATHPGYAPAGCTAATSILTGDSYDYWKARQADGSYDAEKEKLAAAYTTLLESQLPRLAGKIKALDVATPLTYERYCGTFRGSWMTLVGVGDKMREYPYASQSVRHLYFCGQRIMPPGGMPVAASTGRTVVQHLCKDDDVVFQGA